MNHTTDRNHSKKLKMITFLILASVLLLVGVLYSTDIGNQSSSDESAHPSRKKVSEVIKTNPAGTTSVGTQTSPEKAEKTETTVPTPSFLNLLEGNSDTIKLEGVSPEETIQWISSDPAVASVDALGKVTGTGVGQTTITAKSDKINVSVPVNTYQLPKEKRDAKLTILNQEGKLIHYNGFSQHAGPYGKYNIYMPYNGCATCTASTILSAYGNYDTLIRPPYFIEKIERKYTGKGWKRIHPIGNPHTLPLSMNGIYQILKTEGISVYYHPDYSSLAEAQKAIKEQLSTGNPVIIEVGKKNHYTGKRSNRYTNSIHTMALITMAGKNQVILLDSVNRKWYDGPQRFKLVDFDDVTAYMFSSTEKPSGYYYHSRQSDGGFITVGKER